MKDKREIRIRDIILIETIVFFIVLILDFGIMITTDTSPNIELLVLIMNILVIFICLRKIKLNKSRINYLIKDFKANLNIKEIIGRYINTSVLNFGFTFMMVGVFIFINTKVANEILNTSSSQEMINNGNILINVISVAIVAPIFEEIVFRKVLFKRLAKKTNMWIGIILSSLIFGLSHAMDSMVFATLFGVILCILYIKYENILVPMFMHFVNNLMATILLISPTGDEASEIMEVTQQDAVMFISVGIIASIIGIYFYIRYINRNKMYIRKDSKEIL